MQLKLARIERGLNQVRLAAILGASQTATSKIENGIQQPSLEQVFIIEREFGIPAESWLKAAA